MNLDSKDALQLAETLQRGGSDLKGLKAINPWSHLTRLDHVRCRCWLRLWTLDLR